MLRYLLIFSLFFSSFCYAGKKQADDKKDFINNFLGTGLAVKPTHRDSAFKVVPAHQDFGYNYISGHGNIEPDFLEHVRSLPGGRVLDIGAGGGHTFKRLTDPSHTTPHSGQVTYVLNEIDPFAQQAIRNLGKETGRYTPALSKAPVLQHLTNNTAPYDAIFSSMVFHFMPPSEYLEVLLQCHRNLKPGGRLFILQDTLILSLGDMTMRGFIYRKNRGFSFPGHCISREALGLEALMRHFPNANLMDAVALEEVLCREIIGQQGVSYPYPPCHYHDYESLTKLLGHCGFRVISGGLYVDIYPEGPLTNYVGIIAERAEPPLQLAMTGLRRTTQQEEQESRSLLREGPWVTEDVLQNFIDVRLPFIFTFGEAANRFPQNKTNSSRNNEKESDRG